MNHKEMILLEAGREYYKEFAKGVGVYNVYRYQDLITRVLEACVLLGIEDRTVVVEHKDAPTEDLGNQPDGLVPSIIGDTS